MIHAIGDVHGKYEDYIKLIEGLDYTIQVGDFGFEYDILKRVDPTHHIILPGNHDNYDEIYKYYEHVLPGDYGMYSFGGLDFYYVRGAFSPDCRTRVEHEVMFGERVWWQNEQVPLAKHDEIVQDFVNAKPEVVITHDAPKSVIDLVAPYNTDLSAYRWPRHFIPLTQRLLQRMFEAHQPKLWVFGHHHVTTDLKLGRTTFQCVGELEIYQIK